MSTYIDDDLLSMSLNGLASSKEIMDRQLRISTGNTNIRAVDLDQDAFKAVPADLTGEKKVMFDLRQTVGAGATDTPSIAASSTQESPQYFDGPAKTGETVTTVAERYGLTGTVKQTIDDAQDAVLGITQDLTKQKEDKKPLHEILTQDNRLRGIGILLVCTAIMAFVIKILAGA